MIVMIDKFDKLCVSMGIGLTDFNIKQKLENRLGISSYVHFGWTARIEFKSGLHETMFRLRYSELL